MNTVNLPIVEIQHSKTYKFGISLWIIGLLLLIYSIYFKISDETLRLVILIISMILVIVVPIFVGIRRTMIKEYKEIGFFLLNKDCLIISYSDKKEEYNFSDLKNIRLDCSAVAGSQIGRGVGLTDGINNYFHFDFNNNHFQYRILVKNYTCLRILDDLIYNSGLNIELFRYGKKVNRLTDRK